MADKEGALKEKEQGNVAYKAKNFAKAITHYEKVWCVIFLFFFIAWLCRQSS